MFGLTETEIGLCFTACTNWNRSEQRESTAVLISMDTQNKQIFRAGPCFKHQTVWLSSSCQSASLVVILLTVKQSMKRKGNHSFANSPS